MIYPNLRYGNPEHARAYCAGVPLATIARQLRRHPRTVRDWLTGRRKMPWWVPELLQLRHEVAIHDLRRMGVKIGPNRRAPVMSSAGTTGRPATRAPGQHDRNERCASRTAAACL